MAVISGAPWASAGAAVGTQQWNHLFRGVETFAATFLQMILIICTRRVSAAPVQSDGAPRLQKSCVPKTEQK